MSRVLNEPERVKVSTREQVYAVMRELNYTPPTVRRDPDSLSRIIGVFAPNLLLDSLMELVRAVETVLAATSFDLLLVNMRGSRDFGAFIRENSHILKKVDAAVVFSAQIDEHAVEFMKSADIPLVLMQARSPLVRAVSNNNFVGGQDAAKHLIDFGYRRPAFVGWTPWDDHVADRFAGYQSGLGRAGVSFRATGAEYGALSADGGYAATARLLQRTRPDAIFYGCDILAIGGMKRVRELGLRVPEDIGIIGFDDLSVAGAIGLTTMRQFFSRKAEMIVEYLVGRLTGAVRRDLVEEIQVSPGLVVRDTTSPRHTVSPDKRETAPSAHVGGEKNK